MILKKNVTITAGKLAGFEIILIINEPTAAAIAFGLKKKYNNDKTDEVFNMLVFDFGVGTFDVSILTYQDNDYLTRSVKGDHHLGSEDFTKKLVNYCLDGLQRRSIDIKDDACALNRLHEECEKTKCMLSNRESREIPFQSKNESVLINITRDKFEELCETFFSKIMELVIKCVNESKIKKDDIDEIVLVEGSSRIQKIKKILENYFEKPVTKSVNADECIAIGAAIKGAMVSSENNPDVNGIRLVDIIPLSIGVRVRGGIMDPIIERNFKIPASKSKQFTAKPKDSNNYGVKIEIYQGERPLTEENIFLGKLSLQNVSHSNDVKPCIEVTISVLENGTCNITAKDINTGIEQEIILEDVYEPPNVNKLVEEAEKYRDKDFAEKDLILARQKLNDFCYSSLGILESNSSKVVNKELKLKSTNSLQLLPDLPYAALIKKKKI